MVITTRIVCTAWPPQACNDVHAHKMMICAFKYSVYSGTIYYKEQILVKLCSSGLVTECGKSSAKSKCHEMIHRCLVFLSKD